MATDTSEGGMDRVVTTLYPRRSEYEQIVITAPGPAGLARGEEGGEEDVIVESQDFSKLRDAFNAAVLVFTRALVRARVEPVDMKLNVSSEEWDNSDGNVVVLKALLEGDVEVRIETSMRQVKYTIIYPKSSRRSRAIARRVDRALTELLHEPIASTPPGVQDY